MKRLLALLACVVLFAPVAHATTITFTENGFDGAPTDNRPLVGTEWQNLGILVSGVYWYADASDVFDQHGIAVSTVAGAPEIGRIDFINPAHDLSVDWLALSNNDFYLEGYQTGLSTPLFVYHALPGDTDQYGSPVFIGFVVDYLLFHDDGRQIAVSTLRFDTDVVPEPASLLLLGSGLIGLAARRRRRS